MTIYSLLPFVAVLFFLHGCATVNVDEMDPMVPATADSHNDTPAPTQRPEAGGDIIDNSEPQVAPSQTSNDLWQRLRYGYGFDLEQNVRIDAQRDWYIGHADYFYTVMKRSQRYLHYIVTEAEKRQMPLELALLPIVESAFNPFAYSKGHASGPWQFIPSTGKHFNLTQDWWYDGRRDLISSTNAALTYLQQLADRFDGNWLLALASYNAGAGTVARAISRNQAAGLPTDFWHLDLPQETSVYVPRLLAVAELIESPDRYNIRLPKISNQPYFAIIKTPGQVDLTQIAAMADITPQELALLNPGFSRSITPPSGPNRLLVPVTHASTLYQTLQDYQHQDKSLWATYRVQSGDSLVSIGQRYHVSAPLLQQLNRLPSQALRVGQSLKVPAQYASSGKVASYDQFLQQVLPAGSQPQQPQQIRYVVKSGDNPWTIARRYRVPVNDLLAWNQLNKHSVLRPGQTLTLYAGRTAGKTPTHKVAAGDSLWSIARRYDTSVKQIALWNNLKPSAPLRLGQILKVANATSTIATEATAAQTYRVQAGDNAWTIARRFGLPVNQLLTHNQLTANSVLQPGQTLNIPASDNNTATRQVAYSVKPGDSLYAIASRFNTSIAAIQQWNDITSDGYLQPGQSLTLYLDNEEVN